MTLLIFIIILGILVLVHEMGHFLVAKKAGVRVDEFGFGYPPRALKIGKKWGTLFSINWIPFGGFVKIFGEDYEDTPPPDPLPLIRGGGTASSNLSPNFPSPEQGEGGRRLGGVSFVNVSKKWQAVILAAGVIFNIIFAWFLFSLGFIIGLPAPMENDFGVTVKNPVLMVTDIVSNSPAQDIGIKTGDRIKKIYTEDGNALQKLDPQNVSDFVNNSVGKIVVEIDRRGKNLDFEIFPVENIVENRKAIGVNMDMVGTLRLPVHKAFYEGGRITFKIIYLTTGGLFNLIGDTLKGKADISQVAGPVGIVGLVGDASRLGFTYVLTFTALISINLAIINLIPFPALDGGRIVFVAIEGITKKRINPKIAGIVNMIGFAILIILMVFVTYRDILKLF